MLAVGVALDVLKIAAHSAIEFGAVENVTEMRAAFARLNTTASAEEHTTVNQTLYIVRLDIHSCTLPKTSACQSEATIFQNPIRSPTPFRSCLL